MLNPLAMKLEQFTRFSAHERYRLDGLLTYPTTTFQRRRPILRDREHSDLIHLVTEGVAARSKTLADGNRQFMAFLIPGDLCDIEVFVLKEMDHDIVAICDTTCVLIPAAEMEALLSEHSTITRALWWSTMTDSAVLREWIVNNGSRDARARVAHLLCELLVRYRTVGQVRGDRFPFPFTQEEFADATGISPIHMSRVLVQLRAEGLVERRGKWLTVLDAGRLGDIAGYEPRYLHLDRSSQGSLGRSR